MWVITGRMSRRPVASRLRTRYQVSNMSRPLMPWIWAPLKTMPLL